MHTDQKPLVPLLWVLCRRPPNRGPLLASSLRTIERSFQGQACVVTNRKRAQQITQRELFKDTGFSLFFILLRAALLKTVPFRSNCCRLPSNCRQPPSVALQRPSVTLQPPSVALKPLSVTSRGCRLRAQRHGVHGLCIQCPSPRATAACWLDDSGNCLLLPNRCPMCAQCPL